MPTRPSYAARINAVIDHIDRHLAEPLDLEALAAVANFSRWHFHRMFQAYTGETLAERVRRRRLEVAAGRLLASPPATALSIALDVGFGSAEVFTRAFKAHFGVTPSTWRRGGFRACAAERRLELSKIHQAGRTLRQALGEALIDDEATRPTGHGSTSEGIDVDVSFKTLPDTRVAYLRHVGPYGTEGIPRTWQRFEAWCRASGLLGQSRTIYGIAQDSPDVTPPEKCRYDACIAVDEGFRPEGDVGVETLQGGVYACTPFKGTGETISAAWMRLYGDWLPASDYQVDDRPSIEIYGEEVEVDPLTGEFACLLCIPVRPL